MKKKSQMPRRSWASGRGALGVIAILLVSSSIARLGTGAGSAIADEIKDSAENVLFGRKKDMDPVVDISPKLVALLKETQQREQAVAEKEAMLKKRQNILDLVEAAITEDLIRLEEAEAKLRATMATADQAAETDIGRLTSVYENMKTEQAAALFQLMEPKFAAGFLGRMRPDAAAAILAGLEPGLAYSISVVLAGRNASVPREPVPDAQVPTDE